MFPFSRAIRGLPALASGFAFAAAALGNPAATQPPDRATSKQRIIEAYRKGMPLDSLYYLLAHEAIENLSFDTAMAFNLSVATPKSAGPFRDSLLTQRHRLYLLSGLTQDAARLRDSLPKGALAHRRPRRPLAWDIRLQSGYYGETQSAARAYPPGIALPGTDTAGADLKSMGNLSVPLPSPADRPLTLGLGYEAAKTYYKDSLDMRGEVSLKADRILDRISAAVSFEAGRIAGVGSVAAGKAELTWLGLAAGGFWLADAGYEGEWEEFRDKRYDAQWLSAFREWDLGSGRSAQASLSASFVGMDPFTVPGMDKVIFVDDVSATAPTHFRDAAFRDSIPRGSNITRFNRYIEARDSTRFHCPQDVLTLRPQLAFGWSLFRGFAAEINAAYAYAYFPSAYSWIELGGPESVPGDSVEFRGHALNQADGRYYRAFLDSRSGGLTETYGTIPLKPRRVRRVDHRCSAGFVLSRPTRSWGTFTLDLDAERTYSTLSGKAPIWIPEWEYGASLKWSWSGPRPVHPSGRKGAG